MSPSRVASSPSRSPTPIRASQPQLTTYTTTTSGTAPGKALLDAASQPLDLERSQRSRIPSARKRALLESEATPAAPSQAKKPRTSSSSARTRPTAKAKEPSTSKDSAPAPAPDALDDENANPRPRQTSNAGLSQLPPSGKPTAARPPVDENASDTETEDESDEELDKAAVLRQLSRTLEHNRPLVAEHLSILLGRDLKAASKQVLEETIKALEEEQSLPEDITEHFPEVLSLPATQMNTGGGYYLNKMNDQVNSQPSDARKRVAFDPLPNPLSEKRARISLSVNEQIATSSSFPAHELSIPTPLRPGRDPRPLSRSSQSHAPPTSASLATVLNMRVTPVPLPGFRTSFTSSNKLPVKPSGSKPAPPDPPTESESEPEPAPRPPPRRIAEVRPASSAATSVKSRAANSTFISSAPSQPRDTHTKSFTSSQPRDAPATHSAPATNTTSAPSHLRLPSAAEDVLREAGVNPDGLTVDAVVDWALYFAAQRMSADTRSSNGYMDKVAGPSHARDDGNTAGPSRTRNNGNTAGPSRACNDDASRALHARVKASADARTPEQKRRHDRYAPIQPQPPERSDDDADSDGLPETNELLAAIAAAGSGAPTPKKSGLRKFPGVRHRVATAAILDLLATASTKGVYQVTATYRKWARDAYRRVWKRIAKDLPYEPPPDDLLCTMAARVSWLRTKVKERVRVAVKEFYGFIHPPRSDKERKHNRRLFKKIFPDRFHCRTFDPNKDQYEHEALTRCIAAAFFWDEECLGFFHWERFKPMPLPAVAFVLTIMQACIEEYRTGSFERRSLRSHKQQPIFDAHLHGLQQYSLSAGARLRRFQNEWFRFGVENAGVAIEDDVGRSFCQPTISAHQVRPDTPDPEGFEGFEEPGEPEEFGEFEEFEEAQGFEDPEQPEAPGQSEEPEWFFTSLSKGKGRATDHDTDDEGLSGPEET